MKAVIYARYSSDNQREESIEGQLRECTAFAEKNDITILRHYIDRAYSAKTDNRPEFQHMIKDSSKHLFDMVIVWKLDRFSRNRYDSARYKTLLKRNGVKVVSATEVISEGAEGIILESVLEGFAEYYSADLAEKVGRGLTENALKAKFNGGNKPIGYVIDKEQHFQIDPLTAPFVLEAFKRYDEGSTMKELVDYLTENGVRNVYGEKLNFNSIQRMLKNRRYDGQWKSGDHQERIVFKDILLPPNAPKAYADRQTLWNAVDASESKYNAQTARRFIITLPKELPIEENIRLIRDYCQKQFVDRGMIADIAVHFDDKEPPNPHAHILCTMRSMNEQGEWNDKTKTTYALDENGNRIMGKNGKWKRIRIDTVDWNDRKYCEIWRHEWEVMQNAALEEAGRTERVDMRSYERQGIEMAPQVHLGPAAFALEKQGIRTERGNHNNAVKHINNLFSAIRRKLKSMREWLKELIEVFSDHEKLENPGDFPLYQVLFAYYDLRERQRWDWHPGARSKAGLKDFKEKTSLFAFLEEHEIYSVNDFAILINNTNNRFRELDAARKSKEQRIRDIDAILNAVNTLKELKPIQDKYDSTFWGASKERYKSKHADEFAKIQKARGLLYKLKVTLPINNKTLKAESTRLRGEVESLIPELESMKAELDQQMKIRSHIRKVTPQLLAFKTKDGKQSFEDVSEEVQNAKELRELLEESAERALRHDPDPEPRQQPIQDQQQEKQKKAKQQQQGGR